MRFQLNAETVFASTGSGEAPVDMQPDAPAVLFIHGAGMDHSVWVMPARYFARQGYRVLAPDLPAHGRSGGQALESINAMANWLVAVLDAQAIDMAAIVGHSMGSLVAHSFACLYPQRTRSLTLLGTSAPMPVSDMLLEAARDNHHAAIDMANTWSHSPRARLGGNDNPGVWMLGSGERLIERLADGVYHTDFAACNAFKPEQQTWDVATLIIVGEADQMTPSRRGIDLADKLPNARVVKLPGCGHSMLSEAPNQVLDALIDHLSIDRPISTKPGR